MSPLTQIFRSAARLFYPRRCIACGKPLPLVREDICLACLWDLPVTRYCHDPENPVAQMFWGRFPIAHASAYLFFRHGSNYQAMIHRIKYSGRTRVAALLGRMYGQEMKAGGLYGDVDVVVPVPMARAKQFSRGYNQSELIARGVAEALGVPLDVSSFCKRVSTRSQARQSIDKRWENVQGVFCLRDPVAFNGKHILLVDDVVTSGSTVESAAVEILSKTTGSTVSVAALFVSYRLVSKMNGR